MSDVNTLGICWDILLRLPAESLFRFRAVCKGWRAIVDDPGFVKAHTNINQQRFSSNNTTLLVRNSSGHPFDPLYSFNLDDVNFTNNGTQTIPATPHKLSRNGLSRWQDNPVAVCNGLILIPPLTNHQSLQGPTWDPEGTLEIWNPLTHDRLTLLQPYIKSKKVVGFGFGYDPAKDDYKVVVIYNFKEKKGTCQTHVYSLKSDSWRKIENCPFDLYKVNGGHQQGAFLNGALHWQSGDEATKTWDRITVLDLTTEKYHQLACPFLKEHRHGQLDALGGCLLLSCLWFSDDPLIDNRIDKRRFDVWVMNDYGADDSWIKLFSKEGVGVLNQLRLVAYMKNKNGALLQHSNGFSWFDAESNSTKMVSIHGICEYSKKFSAQICVGSLFRLRESCGRVPSEKQTRKKERDSNWEMKMTAQTKLTLCVRDVERDHHNIFFNMSHDCCFGYDSNWYFSSSHGPSPLYTDINLTTYSVPLDMCREILLRLPAKSLIIFRAVCKAWQAVIDDPFFVKAHANKQLSNTTNIIIRNSTGPPFYPLFSFDLYDLNFSIGLKRITATPLDFTSSVLSSRLQVLPMSTCNGLILIAPISHQNIGFNDKIYWDWDRKGTWEIWNPLTHERLELPKLDIDSQAGLTAWGLGYDSSTDDYKAVVISYQYDGKPVEIIPGLPLQEKELYHTHVYSLKSDSWRRIGNCPYDIWQVGCSAFLSGVLYWITMGSYPSDTIFALDLGTENYRQLKLPTLKYYTMKADHRKQIHVLGGCLIMSEYFHNDVRPVFVLWLMKEDGAQCSWEKLFHTNQSNIDHQIRPVAYMKDKMKILVHNGRRGFFLFDVKSESGKKVSIHGLTGDLFAQVVPKSIFRIHDNCGVTGRRRISKMTGNVKMSDTELTFCVRNDDKSRFGSFEDDPHDCCYNLDANWYYPSSEDKD